MATSHAFQFAYNVNSAIMFFVQSTTGAVTGKFCTLLVNSRGWSSMCAMFSQIRNFTVIDFIDANMYVISMMQWAWIASNKTIVPDRTVWLPIHACVIAAVRLSKALKTRTQRNQAICTPVLIASKLLLFKKICHLNTLHLCPAQTRKRTKKGLPNSYTRLFGKKGSPNSTLPTSDCSIFTENESLVQIKVTITSHDFGTNYKLH